jgi:methionine sulfoxide reductase heme-binding subunit
VLVASAAAWYVARAGGIVAFVLLTAGVLLGLVLSGRARLALWPRFAIEDVHRFVGLLTGSFIALHLLGLLVNDYLPFSLFDLVVPGAAPYRTLVTALGVIAMELLVALALTNHFRKRLAYHFWRKAHYLSFAVWLLTLVHGVGAGTDSSTAWGLALYAASGGSVAGLTLWRVLRARSLRPWALRLWPGAAAVVAAELIVALAAGPLHHHS